ncbi:MAG: sigma 54-interacting transcriptional regulator, partial [Firmicutes bacterium]|nr:sigma 54-interacting transcriptional regulator [Bacillota bacterium]
MVKKKEDCFLSHFVDYVTEGVYLSDLLGNIIYMNDSAQNMADGLWDKKEWELFGLPSAVDKCVERETVSYTKRRADGRNFSVTSQILSAEGEERILSVLREKEAEKEDDDTGALLVYKGSSMSHTLNLAAKLAKIDSTVLIVGESGTGKVMLAQYIHSNSNRKDEPFVSFDCAAMPADLLEEEFFGRVGNNGNLEKPGILANAAG